MPKGLKGKDPRRSVYYDAVYNPTGAPPPGFEWKERSQSPESEDDDDDSDEEDSDDDSDGIELPAGPAPAEAAAPPQEDSDDDIPLPAGPPPAQPSTATPLVQRPPPPVAGPSSYGMPVAMARPPPPSRAAIEAARKAATITAEPALRDLRKEATTSTFVPNAVKRKRVDDVPASKRRA